MILLDAYGLVALLTGGPAADQVEDILRRGDAAISTLNLAEALDVSQRTFGLQVGRAMEVLEPLFDGPLRAIAVDVPTAQAAADLRATHYHRSRRPITMADAVLLASAKPGDRVATADPDVLAVAAAIGLGVEALPGES